MADPKIEDPTGHVRALVQQLAPFPAAGAGDDARLVEDLGYHSLLLLELAFAIEEDLGLTPIEEQAATGIVTVGDLLGHVRAQLAAAGQPR